MKKILILTPGPFLKRDHHRFGIDILKKNFLVQVLDCTAWIRQSYWKICEHKVFRSKEYISISCKQDFLNFVSQTNSSIVIDRFPINNKTNWMRKLLRKNNCLFVDLYLNLIPIPERNINQTFTKLFKILVNPKKMLNRLSIFLQQKKYNLIKSNSDIFIVGGLISSDKLKNKNVIKAHSMDYDVYLNIKNKTKNSGANYAVFLDEDMVNHPDYILLNQKQPATEEQYYKTLSNFLKKFELETGLKVKIAFHPKRESQKIPILLKDFDYAFEQTAELVMNSSITLAHQSTSLSYAVLFKKPVTLLTSNELTKSWLGPRIENFSKILNSQIINMDNFLNQKLDIKNFLRIDEKKYKNYLDQYLKVPNSPDLPIWEIFTKQIKNKQF